MKNGKKQPTPIDVLVGVEEFAKWSRAVDALAERVERLERALDVQLSANEKYRRMLRQAGVR